MKFLLRSPTGSRGRVEIEVVDDILVMDGTATVSARVDGPTCVALGSYLVALGQAMLARKDPRVPVPMLVHQTALNLRDIISHGKAHGQMGEVISFGTLELLLDFVEALEKGGVSA